MVEIRKTFRISRDQRFMKHRAVLALCKKIGIYLKFKQKAP